MNKRQLLSRLVKIGMTEKEAKLYVALLGKPEMSAGELHRISGVPRSKTYEMLEKMLLRGYCQQRIENTRRYFKAIQPSFLEEILHQRWKAEFKEMEVASKEALEFLQTKYVQTQSTNPSLNLIEILRNIEHIQLKYLNLVNETNEELLTFNRSPYACLDPKVLEEQRKAITRLPERGGKLKSIYMWEEEQLLWLRPAMEKLKGAGEDVRINDYLPVKMMVFDRKKVLLALADIPGESRADFTMMVIEDSGLIRSFLLLFDSLWTQALSIKVWLEKVGEQGDKRV